MFARPQNGLGSSRSNHCCGGRFALTRRSQSSAPEVRSASCMARASSKNSRYSSGMIAARSAPPRRTMTAWCSAATLLITSAYSWACCGSSTWLGFDRCNLIINLQQKAMLLFYAAEDSAAGEIGVIGEALRTLEFGTKMYLAPCRQRADDYRCDQLAVVVS